MATNPAAPFLPTTRREFLGFSSKGIGLLAFSQFAPQFLVQSTLAATPAPEKDRSVLVLVQLAGGNDGLNTLIPFEDPDYYRLRPTLGIPKDKVLRTSDSAGLHPSCTALHGLFESGKLAIVQNVGYPNPNRSHFRSTEIWQTANPDMPEQYGWLGKYLDDQLKVGSTNPVLALELGRTKSAAFNSKVTSVPCFASLADVKALVGDEDAERFLREIQGMGGGADEASVRQATTSALDAMAELNASIDKHQSKHTYANDSFGQGFKQIA